MCHGAYLSRAELTEGAAPALVRTPTTGWLGRGEEGGRDAREAPTRPHARYSRELSLTKLNRKQEHERYSYMAGQNPMNLRPAGDLDTGHPRQHIQEAGNSRGRGWEARLRG